MLFRHPAQAEPALLGVSLRIASRDRVLLDGAAGAGKSTLAAVLAGLRDPQGGLVLVDGLERKTVGNAAWRRRVTLAPQFHENHVRSAILAFNLLMGRRWPPRPDDLAEALEVCRELGLGRLVDRMPAGLAQMVGETGWQLSHGERSRLFIARALLKSADLVVLDENCAALDPQTWRAVAECIDRRARAVLLIAHPS